MSDLIGRCFAADSVEEIIARLGEERGDQRAWAEAAAHDLLRRSPTSLKLTHRHLRRAGAIDLRATLVENYRIAHQCLEGADFYEGVRAVVIDKDGAPNWQPARLEEVTETLLAPYFGPPEDGDLTLASRAEMQALQT